MKTQKPGGMTNGSYPAWINNLKRRKRKRRRKKKKGSDSSGEESEDEWVESDKNKSVDTSVPDKTKGEGEKMARDNWMEMGLLSTYSRDDFVSKKEKRDQEKRELEAKNAPGTSSRELNPFFKNNGSGIPPEETNTSKPTATIAKGDGGVSWLMKAYKRAEEQAKQEGIPLEEIAAKRWGSLEKFNQMLATAKEKAGMIQEQRKPASSSYRRSPIRDRSRERKRSSSRDRKRSRSRDRKRSRSRDRKRSRSRERKRSRSRERKRSRSRSRNKKRSRSRSRDRRRDRSRSRDKRDRSRSPGIKFARPGESSKSYSSNRYSSSGGWKTSQRKEEERSRQREDEAKRKKAQSSSSSSSDSDSDSEKAPAKEPEEQQEAPKVLTETELNSLASKIVKAEIMGNDEMVAQLKAKLAAAKALRADFIANGGNPDDDKPETVTKIKFEDTKGKRKKTKVETHKDGQRVRYFGDDDKYDLKQMFEREKLNTAEDQNSMLSSLAGKGANDRTNEDFDMDDMLVSKAARKKNEEKEEAKQLNKAAAKQLEMEKTLEDCKWCIGSKRSSKHLMVSMGKSVYLSVPGHTSMVDGHCLIVPMGHVTAGTHLDEDVWQEVQEYRKALVRMFRKKGEDCVFFETAVGFKRHPHMVLECIPLSEDMGSMAPMYFQKAIQECESEWSDNKKLIKLKDKKISRNVPKGLPYFHVDFGLDNGFAHVIEEEANFSRRFGHEIVGGMLDIEARTFRNPAWEQFDVQKRKVIEFSNMWKDFDWTKRLQERGGDSDSSSDSD